MLQFATLALSSPMTIGLIVAGVLAVGLLLYGIFKKFSRMSWVGWQIPIIFGICMLVALFAPLPGGAAGFAILAGTVFGASVLILGAGAIIRSAMWRKKKRAHVIFRIFDRILGIFTALLNLIVPIASFAGFVLWLLNVFLGGSGALSAVFDSSIWGMVGPFALDLSLVTFLIYALKGGYRLGFGRFLWLAFTLVLTFFAVFGSIYLVLSSPALGSFAHTLADSMANLGRGTSAILGYTFAALILFLAFFVVIVILSVLINLIFKQVNKVRWLNVFSGCIMAAIFFLVALAILVGIGIGVHQLAALASQEGSIVAEYAGEYILRFEEAISSSPFAGHLYLFDPLSMLG